MCIGGGGQAAARREAERRAREAERRAQQEAAVRAQQEATARAEARRRAEQAAANARKATKLAETKATPEPKVLTSSSGETRGRVRSRKLKRGDAVAKSRGSSKLKIPMNIASSGPQGGINA